MSETKRGIGKLYDVNNVNFVSDIEYLVVIETKPDGYLHLSGELRGLETSIAISIANNPAIHTLRMDDGTTLRINLNLVDVPNGWASISKAPD